MAVLDVVFEVPKWVDAGVRSGELQVFGGVVRDNAGRIVFMLRDASRRAPRLGRGKFVIVAVVIAAAAGGGYFLYRRYSRKGRTLAALESVESTITAYLGHARERRLTRGDVEALAAALQTFLDHLRKPEFSDVQISLPKDVYEKLQDFLRSLHAFNHAAHEEHPALPTPPAAITHGGSLEPLLDELLRQVRYQGSALEVVRAT
jgi:hypothetical protein